MPGFADSFWSGDYAGGLGVLFAKLNQGVTENQQVLTIASMRADAEEIYGERMADIAPTLDRMNGGFSRDDGASVRKAYEGVRSEMIDASKSHYKIASNIRELVVNPFSRWCDSHAARIQSSHDDLQTRIKAHDRQAEAVKKLRSQYFNKVRLVEDLEEEDKLAFQGPAKETSSPKQMPTPTIRLPEDHPEEEPIQIGDQSYNPDEVKRMLTQMLSTIPLGEAKVSIIGTYQNVSTGSDIVDYLQKNMNASSISYAERIGQDLVTHGFLRLIGNIGNTFANSSKMNYQWKTKVFQITGIPERKKQLDRVSSIASTDGIDSPITGVAEVLAGWNPLNNPHPNETPVERLRREARESDERYKAGVKRLDLMRCNLEEIMIDHLKFMERCELDRLKAVKAVILDFSGAISNVIPALQSNVDNMMLFQETIQPLGDLRYLLENYRTGAFIPKVQPYENYYNSVDDQTFGVDLEARARADRKRVPMIITALLTFLDHHYPDLEGDEARRAIWLADVPLAATHHLRNQINNGQTIPQEVLDRYEVPIVASVLKLYLLELPDSIVSSQVYEIVKTIYSQTASETTEATRISVLQSTLGQLRLVNIASLDALSTHFTRLIELTSAGEEYVAALAQALAPCILRPRVDNSLTMHERHSYRLIRDLFDHKDAIFGELKRQSSSLGLPSNPSNPRPRAVSTDESNRRAAMEARQKAITEKSRASSPAPTSRHRRDRSTGGPETTRFPVATPGGMHSPTSFAERRATARQSLEVPGSLESTPVADKPATPTPTSTWPLPIQPGQPVTSNGSIEQHPPPPPIPPSNPTYSPISEPGSAGGAGEVEKRNSLSRGGPGSGGRFSRKPITGRQSVPGVRRGTGSKDSLISEEADSASRMTGVTLEDRPMHD